MNESDKQKLDQYLANPHAADDPTTEAAFKSAVARVDASIKDAVAKGVKTGISGEPARLIPPPPTFDMFHGKTCEGPGVPGRFGKPKLCGRQAVAWQRRFKPDIPDYKSFEDQAAELDSAFAMSAYGGINGRIPVGGGPAVGRLVPDPNVRAMMRATSATFIARLRTRTIFTQTTIRA